MIQEREGLLLHEIIEKYGLERFNQIESEVNASIEAEDTSLPPVAALYMAPKR